jgi:hypothetical protein
MICVMMAYEPHLYLAGIFANESDLRAYEQELPANFRYISGWWTLPAELTFPVFLVEALGGMVIHGPATVVGAMSAMRPFPSDDPEDEVVNVYKLLGPWRPGKAGRDEMGLLDHHHFTQEEIKQLAAYFNRSSLDRKRVQPTRETGYLLKWFTQGVIAAPSDTWGQPTLEAEREAERVIDPWAGGM